MKITADRPFADPEKGARKLLEIATATEVVQDGRIYIEKINGQFLFKEGGTPAEYSAALACQGLAVETRVWDVCEVHTCWRRAVRLKRTLDVQSLQHCHEPGGDHRAFPGREPVVGNLPPKPGVFPDYPAPVVRNASAERELTMMRWGCPLLRSSAAAGHQYPEHLVTALASLVEAGKAVPGAGQQLLGIRARAQT